MGKCIDLNADLGEECGDDESLLAVVTSANIACGGHAGGGQTLLDTMRSARAHQVAVGAHPSYPDRAAFGRVSRFQAMARHQLFASVVSQIVQAGEAATRAGTQLTHVKAHGALYNDAASEPGPADALLTAVLWACRNLDVDTLPVLGMTGSPLHKLADARGIPFLREAFADRVYLPSGLLAPRAQPNAVHHDPHAAIDQAIRIAVHQEVVAIDGTTIPMRADTLCLHGDTPGAADMARLVRQALEAHGVELAAPERLR